LEEEKKKKGGGDYTLSGLIHKGEIATTINCHLTWDLARRDDKRHAKESYRYTTNPSR